MSGRLQSSRKPSRQIRLFSDAGQSRKRMERLDKKRCRGKGLRWKDTCGCGRRDVGPSMGAANERHLEFIPGEAMDLKRT